MRRSHGFTLVEMMVVVSIIALLLSVLIPSVSKARESARLIQCAAQERGIYQTTDIYSGDFKGRIPDRGGDYCFPNYSFGTPAMFSNGQMLGNYILEAPQYVSGTNRSAFTNWAMDYLNLSQQMWVSPMPGNSSVDRYLGFTSTKTLLHCPSRKILDKDPQWPASQPNPFISYVLSGFGGFTNYYGPATDRPCGYPILENISAIHAANGASAQVPMMIDMANHDDGGNVAGPDGSVKRFGVGDSFVLPTSSTIRVPVGYAVLYASKHAYSGSPTADQYCQLPLDMTQYWHPVNGVLVTDIATSTAYDNIRAWGYSYNGR